MRNRVIRSANIIATVAMSTLLMMSCSSAKTDTSMAPDTKYLADFQQLNFSGDIDGIAKDKLTLYVDYSTCIAQGQSSPLFTAIVPSLASATKKYMSIKGDTIAEEQGDTYTLLKNINEVDYADLKSAAEKIADGNTEAVLLTDGEYYQKTIAKSNVNNPYLEKAFKKWLQRGHDIYILIEPYQETRKGNSAQESTDSTNATPGTFNKKRFYFIFTDSRLADNIYNRISSTVDLTEFPEATMFHLSISHPALTTEQKNGNLMAVNENVGATQKNMGNFEIQDWSIDWKNILSLVRDAADENGNELENGNPVFYGFGVDKNSFGGYRISEIGVRTYDVSAPYAEFYDAKANHAKVTKFDQDDMEDSPNFLLLDTKEFEKHSKVKVYFDKEMFDPSVLNGKPYNYTKVDFYISKVDNVFDQFEKLFFFDSIDVPGETNTSVAESIKQCLADPEISESMKKTPIYTVYIKSDEYSE